MIAQSDSLPIAPMKIGVGDPAMSMYDKLGYVARIIESDARIFTLGAGRMTPIRRNLEIVFDDRISEVPESIAEPWLARARCYNHQPITPEAVEVMRTQAIAAQTAKRDAAAEEQRLRTERAAAFKAEATERMPAGAKAVIVAELVKDESDSMTDYFGSTTTRTVILAWSAHTRDLFPEMRQAALAHPDTAFLHGAPESAEHREKYSMGGGYYLKDTLTRHSDGWRISKKRLQGPESVPVGEWAPGLTATIGNRLPTTALITPLWETVDPKYIDTLKRDDPKRFADLYQQQWPLPEPIKTVISEHVHTQKGFRYWIVQLAARVDRDEYERLLNKARSMGGWYSRAWGDSPAGFAFKDETHAHAFAAELNPPTEPEPPKGGPDSPKSPRDADSTEPSAESSGAPVSSSAGNGISAKLRTIADRMQADIDHAFRDRLTNTPRRQREAQAARVEGQHLQRTQQALRALADARDAGMLSALLADLTTKAAVHHLTRSIIERGGYYDGGRDTGRPALDTPAAWTLWALLAPPNASQARALQLRDKIEALRLSNIPGYFPTPPAIVAMMLDQADIRPGMTVLEPSAGDGAILDAVRAACPNAILHAYERHEGLREVLRLKGYALAGSDFMEAPLARPVDRVLMNPPFEKGQDMLHVMRAWHYLKRGGRLVAIMSPGPFFRRDMGATTFRQWFAEHGGVKTDLPAGSFKASGTDVSAVMVMIEREG